MNTLGDTAGPAAQPEDLAEEARVYRLRDLSRNGKIVAAVLAILLALPTAIAFFQFLPIWRPMGDPAVMALRAWDVGTSRTPLTGQPSTSGHYAGDEIHVDHLGPWHFYVMAPFVRLLGSAAGMLVVSLLVSWSATLLSVWAVFRRLGAAGGVVAAAAMTGVLFGIGSAGLINPISSNFAKMPLLCAAVLVWAVLSGDGRLLPLATVVVSFAVQQHLSVGPTMAILALVAALAMGIVTWRAHHPADDADLSARLAARLPRGGVNLVRSTTARAIVAVVGGALVLQAFRVAELNDASVQLARAVLLAAIVLSLVAGLLGWWRVRRPDPDLGRSGPRLVAVSAGLGLVMWAPLLAQEVFGDRGNLSALFTYTREGGGETLGLDFAFRQLVHAVGLPPLLFDTRLEGTTLLERPPLFTTLSAVALLAVAAVAGYRWLRAGDRRGGLVLAIGVLVLGALANGSSIPRGIEEGRIVFYHWIWPLTFFILITLAYVIGDVGRAALGSVDRWPSSPGAGQRARLNLSRGAVAVTVVGMLGLAVVNPGLDRQTNALGRMSATYERKIVESLADQVMEHDDLLAGRSVMVVSTGAGFYDGIDSGLTLHLRESGQEVVFPRKYWTYVHNDHLAEERDDVDAVVHLVINRPPDDPDRSYLGEHVASYAVWDGFDWGTYETLLTQLVGPDPDAPEIELGPEIERYVQSLDANGQTYVNFKLDLLHNRPDVTLLNQEVLHMLQEYPLASPQLEGHLLARLEDNLADHPVPGDTALSMDVYLITDPDELETALGWQSAGSLT